MMLTSVLSRPNLIHVSLRVAEMNLFSPSLLRGSRGKYHFCPPQADVNLVVPQQNGRKRSIQHTYDTLDGLNYDSFIFPKNYKLTCNVPHPFKGNLI